MGETKTKINSFQDLKAWQAAFNLVLFVYKITKGFPEDEKFGLISQMRRAGVSISSSIAEGFARRSGKDKKNFYAMAKSSLSELENQYLIAESLDYIKDKGSKGFWDQSETVGKLISGLEKSASDK